MEHQLAGSLKKIEFLSLDPPASVDYEGKLKDKGDGCHHHTAKVKTIRMKHRTQEFYEVSGWLQTTVGRVEIKQWLDSFEEAKAILDKASADKLMGYLRITKESREHLIYYT